MQVGVGFLMFDLIYFEISLSDFWWIWQGVHVHQEGGMKGNAREW